MANEDEFYEKHSILNFLGDNFKKVFVPFMPDYVNCIVSDLGINDYNISGCRICIPPLKDNEELTRKKLKSAIKRGQKFGADVVILDPLIPSEAAPDSSIEISKGNSYSPLVYIDALKTVTSLMGMDFRRCSICIADASTYMGRIMTQLLINEVSYLTLCTHEKYKLMETSYEYMTRSGISSAVVSDYKKAVENCDVLIYTGKSEIIKFTANVRKKMVIANVTSENLTLEKDLLVVDEVILKGEREPSINRDDVDINIFLTSKIWEGVLSTISQLDTKSFSFKNALELNNLAEKIGLKMMGIIGGGRIIDRETIYRYR